MVIRAPQPQAMISQNIHCDQATHNANGVNRATSPQKVISALRTAPVRKRNTAGPAGSPVPLRHLDVVPSGHGRARGTRSGQPARTIAAPRRRGRPQDENAPPPPRATAHKARLDG